MFSIKITLLVLSTPTEAPSISIGRYEFASKKLELVSSLVNKLEIVSGLVNKLEIEPKGTIWKSFVHTPKEGHPDSIYEKVKFNSIYIGPESGETGSGKNWPFF